ncbi:MAG: hypothetical protein ABJQ67_11010 [Marinobacter sp.]
MSIQDMTPHDKLMTAIGILQAKLMADDSALDADAMFGGFLMTERATMQAIDLLTDLLDVVPDTEEVP